jgi:hypothetical protein
VNWGDAGQATNGPVAPPDHLSDTQTKWFNQNSALLPEAAL